MMIDISSTVLPPKMQERRMGIARREFSRSISFITVFSFCVHVFGLDEERSNGMMQLAGDTPICSVYLEILQCHVISLQMWVVFSLQRASQQQAPPQPTALHNLRVEFGNESPAVHVL